MRTIQQWGCVIYGILNVKAAKSLFYLLPVWLCGRILFCFSFFVLETLFSCGFLRWNGTHQRCLLVPFSLLRAPADIFPCKWKQNDAKKLYQLVIVHNICPSTSGVPWRCCGLCGLGLHYCITCMLNLIRIVNFGGYVIALCSCISKAVPVQLLRCDGTARGCCW